MKEFAAAEWQRAERALDSARQIVPGDPDSAASRAYYAAFHALTALFALRGQTFSKHSAIRAAMHRDLVQNGLLAADRGLDYDFLMDLRETGDYGGLMQVTPENAQAAVDKAASFMDTLKHLQPELS